MVPISFSNLTFFLFLPVATEPPNPLLPLLSPFVPRPGLLRLQHRRCQAAEALSPLPRSEANPYRSRCFMLRSTASCTSLFSSSSATATSTTANPNYSNKGSLGAGAGIAQLPSTTSAAIPSATRHASARMAASPSSTLLAGKPQNPPTSHHTPKTLTPLTRAKSAEVGPRWRKRIAHSSPEKKAARISY